MQSVAFAVPLLPGQAGADRIALAWCRAGARTEACQDARRRAGIIREAAWIQPAPGGDAAVACLEAGDPDAAFPIPGLGGAVGSLVPRPRPPGPRHRPGRRLRRARAGARLRHQQDLTPVRKGCAMRAQLITTRLKPGTGTAEPDDQLRAAEQPGSGLVRTLMMHDQKDPGQVYALVVSESGEKARASGIRRQGDDGRHLRRPAGVHRPDRRRRADGLSG